MIQTRDSDPLERSNFRTVLADLGGESETVEVHRFGHWANGWFEIILCHPDLTDKVSEWESALSDYPVASDSDFSELEYEEYEDYWQHGAAADFADALVREHGLGYELKGWLRFDAPLDAMRELYESGLPSGDYYESNNMGSRQNASAKTITRDRLAAFVQEYRKRG